MVGLEEATLSFTEFSLSLNTLSRCHRLDATSSTDDDGGDEASESEFDGDDQENGYGHLDHDDKVPRFYDEAVDIDTKDLVKGFVSVWLSRGALVDEHKLVLALSANGRIRSENDLRIGG